MAHSSVTHGSVAYDTAKPCSIEDIVSSEHFHLDIMANSWARSVNHIFTEETHVQHYHEPGVYISMVGQCQGQTLNKGMDSKRDYSHQYMVAVVNQPCMGQMRFTRDSVWQTLSIMLPLNQDLKKVLLPSLRANFSHEVPQISLAELGAVPEDIHQCCEAVWHCPFSGFERELFIKAKAQEALALFLHHRKQPPALSLTSSRQAQLRQVLNHIERHLAQTWTLPEVAKLAGSNRTYVKQDIKNLTGNCFREWLKQSRLEAACRQLAGHHSITDIANNVGFKSQAHFATLFKSKMGITPREYRQSLSPAHCTQT